MAVPDELYERIAVEVTKTILGQISIDQVVENVGWDRVVTDVFDLTDSFCAELERRLERNHAE